MRVLIASPLRQEEHIFREYQTSLLSLNLPDGVIADLFFVVNDCPALIPLIRGRWVELNTGDVYRKDETTHHWTDSNLEKMSILRNRCIQEALEGGYDFLFFVDSDLVLHPDTLKVLLEGDKDIISELFWTNGWCNCWGYDQYGGTDRKWAEPGLYEVGMTGACLLISRRVLESGVDYSPIPNIRYLHGEDRWFCIRAVCHGFTLWTDSHLPPYHLYNEKEYQEYINARRAENAE